LIGTFVGHHAWASWAASGAVLSAIYLLWAYQRVALGEVTVEKNRTLPDASNGRERLILATMAVHDHLYGHRFPALHPAHGSFGDKLCMMEQVEPSRNASRPMLDSPPAL
jgi:hypothetical protein